MRILITGATGFLGRALTMALVQEGFGLTAAIRNSNATLPSAVTSACISTIDHATDWSDTLDGIDAVIHCAARVHVTKETALDSLATFRRTNTDGTLRLAKQAADAGIKRFIFISTIGVNGTETGLTPFTPDSQIAPNSPYAQSKWEAEKGLFALAVQTGMEVVVIRPPLIYGRGAPGNFASLLRGVDQYFPFPFGCVRNKRSFAAIDNVVSLIRCCLDHPSAANQVFLVSDGNDLSTADFIRKLAAARGKLCILLPIPAPLLAGFAACLNKEKQLRKITGSLQIDIRKNAELLGWTPPVSVEEALRQIR
ncbi:nucleoside-diphosphate-sugar epimerase [Herbaspirillum sp. SJZ099]|nr:nucleoside-diphosphate-sugar epimerase [Herbaspirillum sp. SJZ099]